ncbi:MAG: hypothetical protein ACI9GH_000045 [Candidatus Paceibacteria bacterium]|jgi:hypothetical protein
MDKNFLQDVVPPAQKKSIRNIPIPKNRKKVSKEEPLVAAVKINKVGPRVSTAAPVRTVRRTISGVTPPQPTKRTRVSSMADFEERGGGRFKKIGIIGSGIVGILVLVIFLLNLSGTEVRISPKEAQANIETTLEANHVDIALSEELSYKPLNIESTSSGTVKASGEASVKTKASGKIVVSNKYSKDSYPLIKNTRFQNEDGLIYRVDNSISVPGYKEVDGKVVPGELIVEVFADSTGDEYNIKETTFTIPGFSGLKQFDKFSAKTQGGMTGGFVGIKKIVSEEDKEKVVEELKSKIKEDLISKINEDVTDNFLIHYTDDSFIFEITSEEDKGDTVIEITLKGTLEAFVFDTNSIGTILASKTLSNINLNENIAIQNPDNISFEITPSEDDKINVLVKGQVHFVWQTDIEALKESLAGSQRKDMKDVLQDFPSITRAEATVKPLWKKSFPKDASKIDVIIELENIDEE